MRCKCGRSFDWDRDGKVAITVPSIGTGPSRAFMNRKKDVELRENLSGAADAEPAQWACTRCTYLNHPGMPRCEMCRESRAAAPPPGPISLHF